VIGIPFYIWDMAEEFDRDVVQDFVAEYAAGRTPNPCLRCNEKIKFQAVLERALALGFDAVCTGHHVRLENGRLRRSVDAAKDQSYVLAVLTREQLAHAIFPLGDCTKEEVRAEAARRGLTVADKPDSHDICFIADGDTSGFLERRLGSNPGPIVDETGQVVGEHLGSARVHCRPAPRAQPERCPPPPLCPVDRTGEQHSAGGAARGAQGGPYRRGASRVVGGVSRRRSGRRSSSSCGPMARCTPAGHGSTRGGSRSCWTSQRSAWRRGRQRCCTTATW